MAGPGCQQAQAIRFFSLDELILQPAPVCCVAQD
jgi:hypothetical protein